MGKTQLGTWLLRQCLYCAMTLDTRMFLKQNEVFDRIKMQSPRLRCISKELQMNSDTFSVESYQSNALKSLMTHYSYALLKLYMSLTYLTLRS